MKNSIATFICAMALSTTFVFANHIEDKATASVNKSLPAYAPAIESPAPQRMKSTSDLNKYTPTQKASIVDLKITKGSVK